MQLSNRPRRRRNTRKPTSGGSGARPALLGVGTRLQTSSHRTRRPGWGGSMRLGVLFLVLVAINVYVFFFRSGTSIRDVLKQGAAASAALKSPAAKERARREALEDVAAHNVVVQGTMQGHVGLLGALVAHKVTPAQANALVAALGEKLNLRGLRPDQRFELAFDPATREVQRFTYWLSSVVSVQATRTDDGGYDVERVERKLEAQVERLYGKVTSSLNQAITERGGNSALVAKFMKLFAWDINWYTDPREGDEVRIVAEKRYLGKTFHGYGPILAAEYHGKVGRFRVFRYEHEGKGGHYTPEGRSVRRSFLKTPLDYRRISSRYNLKRFHPVLHQTRGHFGVDYAASRGTPVWAAADGKVVSAARSAGAGNMVVLGHAGGVATVYMHLHRFGPGIKPGVAVQQRQVIGAVGSTGLSTGPHLHYGIKVRGRHVDPLSFQVPRGELLPAAARERFLAGLAARVAELEAIPTR